MTDGDRAVADPRGHQLDRGERGRQGPDAGRHDDGPAERRRGARPGRRARNGAHRVNDDHDRKPRVGVRAEVSMGWVD